jgi:hypothetical protein
MNDAGRADEGRADEVAAVAQGIRRKAEEVWGREGLRDVCDLCSLALAQSLTDRGTPARVVQGKRLGRPHMWVVCRNFIIDVTYSEFGPEGVQALVTREGDSRYEPRLIWHDLAFVYSLPQLQDRQKELALLIC